MPLDKSKITAGKDLSTAEIARYANDELRPFFASLAPQMRDTTSDNRALEFSSSVR